MALDYQTPILALHNLLQHRQVSATKRAERFIKGGAIKWMSSAFANAISGNPVFSRTSATTSTLVRFLRRPPYSRELRKPARSRFQRLGIAAAPAKEFGEWFIHAINPRACGKSLIWTTFRAAHYR
ncbi:hypothetical protein VARIO8X_120295 [Burkholderiales bacterium 8X]|nr:hypothetical protein VARIO8X_120295 [Burkholderiales bacterium 8X]